MSTTISPTTTRLAELLVNRPDCFLSAKHGKWFMQKLPLTPELLEAASDGLIPLSLYAVSENGTSRWSAWDADDDALLPQLHALARHLALQGHILLESSRRGGHLFAFHQATRWDYAHAYGVQLAHQFGLDDIEIFPKHQGLHSLRMPGSVHPKTGQVYPAIDPITGELLDTSAALSRISPISTPSVVLPEVEAPTATGSSNPSQYATNETFEDLVEALSALTHVKVYAPNRGIARCPWHDDKSPSLYLKDDRMHCLSARCGVWGSASDVRRFIEQGVRPPA